MRMHKNDEKIGTLVRLLRYQCDGRINLAILRLLSRLVNPYLG